jgi:hypothetical protein
MGDIGCLIKVGDEFKGLIWNDILNKSEATIQIPVQWKFDRKNRLGLISLSKGEINFLSIIRKESKITSSGSRGRIFELLKLNPPIKPDEIKNEWSIKSRCPINKNLKNKTFEEKELNEIKKILFRIRENQEGEIRRILDLINGNLYSNSDYAIVRQIRDANNLAFRLSGFSTKKDKDIIAKSYNLEYQYIPPFVKDIEEISLKEDDMIFNDLNVFGDWNRIGANAIGYVEFEKENRKLTILNTNRKGAEEILGVDLIYYHDFFKSYTLIQYKRMLKSDIESTWGFRPDRTFEKELEKMRFHASQIFDDDSESNLVNFRFNYNPFFFKFCPAEVFDLNDKDLVRGMYIPLDYWKALERSKNTHGPRGGMRITYNNVLRHFNNSEFINLVQKGWIGTKNFSTRKIEEIISNSLTLNRTVLLAKYQSQRN